MRKFEIDTLPIELQDWKSWKGPQRSSPTINLTLPSSALNISPSTTSRNFLNFSRDGYSTTSLGSLNPCLTTLSVKKFFLICNPSKTDPLKEPFDVTLDNLLHNLSQHQDHTDRPVIPCNSLLLGFLVDWPHIFSSPVICGPPDQPGLLVND